MVVPFVYTEEEYKKLGEEIRRLLEKNKIYSNALVQEKEENKKLKEERDFFKEQAILWRNDYKNEYEENKNLKKELGKITVHSNMLESENILLKKECKARLDKIEELKGEIERLKS